jgi:SAM-dependent methyltransferase
MLAPIAYVRYREFAFAFRAIRRHCRRAPREVLDVSSPDLLPLTVACSTPECRVLVVNILEGEVASCVRAAGTLGMQNLRCEQQDVRALSLEDGRFDLVTCVSVLEHVAPEDGGDVIAVREMARVLAPGGIAVLTVPFAREYFAEYKAGNVYERTSDGDDLFFQRFYDRDRLMKDIIAESGLDVLELGFIEERFVSRNPHKRLSGLIDSTPRQRALFGPWYPLLARLFLSGPRPLRACRKPYIACLVLGKDGT